MRLKRTCKWTLSLFYTKEQILTAGQTYEAMCLFRPISPSEWISFWGGGGGVVVVVVVVLVMVWGGGGSGGDEL